MVDTERLARDDFLGESGDSALRRRISLLTGEPAPTLHLLEEAARRWVPWSNDPLHSHQAEKVQRAARDNWDQILPDTTLVPLWDISANGIRRFFVSRTLTTQCRSEFALALVSASLRAAHEYQAESASCSHKVIPRTLCRLSILSSSLLPTMKRGKKAETPENCNQGDGSPCTCTLKCLTKRRRPIICLR